MNVPAAATELAVPDEAVDALHARTGLERRDARAIATPVVTAELLALMDTVGALHGNGGPAYRDGYDRAIGEVRELLADRLDELGVKVEEL